MTDSTPEHPDPEFAQLAGTTGRLAAEFVGVDPAAIGRIVAQCHRDLRGVPAGALPELVERLARQRLLDAQARGRDGSAKAVRAAAKATEPAPRGGAQAIGPPARARARPARRTSR